MKAFLFESSRIKLWEKGREKFLCFIKTLKGIYTSIFVFVMGRETEWRAEVCVQYRKNSTKQTPKAFRRNCHLFPKHYVMIVFYIRPRVLLLKNLENLCGNASSCFVSHLPFLLPLLRALVSSFYASSCLNKQFTGNSWMNTEQRCRALKIRMAAWLMVRKVADEKIFRKIRNCLADENLRSLRYFQ